MKFLILFIVFNIVWAETNSTEKVAVKLAHANHGESHSHEESKDKMAEAKKQDLQAEKMKAKEEMIETKAVEKPVEMEVVKTKTKTQPAVSKKMPVEEDSKAMMEVKEDTKVEMEVKKDSTVKMEVSETESVAVTDPTTQVSAISGVTYVCAEDRSYTFYEPANDTNYLCELDAGHTEQPTDWYALNDAGFCKAKIEELISLHNCSQETE